MDAEVSTHTFLTTIIEDSVCFMSCNCITLKIHSKADFKSKSQNIWQQTILFSHRVMQMICMWPKIWTLTNMSYGRQSDTVWKTIWYSTEDNLIQYGRQFDTVWKTIWYSMEDNLIQYGRHMQRLKTIRYIKVYMNILDRD
jgi:hypothetical protein